jgi:hypothetical protein
VVSPALRQESALEERSGGEGGKDEEEEEEEILTFRALGGHDE